MPDRPGTTFGTNNGSPAPAIDGNYVVFFESANTSALWSVNTVTGQYTRLADTTTAVPGGTSTFNSFNSTRRLTAWWSSAPPGRAIRAGCSGCR